LFRFRQEPATNRRSRGGSSGGYGISSSQYRSAWPEPTVEGSRLVTAPLMSGRLPIRWDAGRPGASCCGEPVARSTSRARRYVIGR